MKKKLDNIIKESMSVKAAALEKNIDAIEQAAKAVIACLKNGDKVLLFGNGGSFADSLHIGAELLGRYKIDRRPLPCIVLGANISALTAISNDFGYDQSFSKELEALGKKGDVAIAISTSGRSKNVNQAALRAKDLGLKVIALTGSGGGELAKIADIPIVIPSENTPRIQEAHIAIGHAICEVVEQELFKNEK